MRWASSRAGMRTETGSGTDTTDVNRLIKQHGEIQKLIDKQSKLLEHSTAARGVDAYYDTALSMLGNTRTREAFNLSAEPKETREKYGRTTYGQSLLLARRLVEAGVRFVNVYFSDTIGGKSTTSGGWGPICPT